MHQGKVNSCRMELKWGVLSKGINKEDEMTPMTRVRVCIRQCSRHDKAVMLRKYFLFTRLNVFQMVENRLINNRSPRLRRQIIRNDIKKQFYTVRLREDSRAFGADTA